MQWSVKTPLQERMEVARSGLWAPDKTHFQQEQFCICPRLETEGFGTGK